MRKDEIFKQKVPFEIIESAIKKSGSSLGFIARVFDTSETGAKMVLENLNFMELTQVLEDSLFISCFLIHKYAESLLDEDIRCMWVFDKNINPTYEDLLKAFRVKCGKSLDEVALLLNRDVDKFKVYIQDGLKHEEATMLLWEIQKMHHIEKYSERIKIGKEQMKRRKKEDENRKI